MGMAIIDMTIKHTNTLEIEIGNVYSKINGDIPIPVLSALDDSLSYYVEGYQYSKLFRDGFYKNGKWIHWDGKKHLFYNSSGFNTGLLERVKEILTSKSMKFMIKDNRIIPKSGKEIVVKKIKCRDYQKRAVEEALKQKGGIVKIATGGGKSIVLADLAAKLNVKTIIFVPGLDLLYQTKDMVELVLGKKIGIIGDGIVDIKDVTISTIWSAANALSKKLIKFDDEDSGRKERFKSEHKKQISDAIKSMEMAIFDECHMVSCQSIQIINSAAKNCYYKFGFSGTPQKFSGEDLLIEGVLGRKIIDIPASELISAGFLVRPTIHFIDVPESTEELGGNYHSIYKKYIVENDIRNDKIVSIANKLKNAGRKTLILVKNIKHGEELLEKFDPKTVIYFVRGELESEERNEIRENFIDGKIDIIIASAVYDQGIDISNLDSLILAGSGKSSGRALQRIGRVIRPSTGKKDAIIVDFVDNAKYLYKHSAARKRIYETEDGFIVKVPKDFGSDNVKEKSIKNKVRKKLDAGEMPW